jgi:hypothetical protein
MVDSNDDPVPVRLLWVDLDETPLFGANQMIGQVEQDEIFITFGAVTPPVILGSQEERLEQARGLGYVPVRPITRLQVTRRRLDEFIRLLTQTRDNYDALHDGSGEKT